MKRVFTEYEVGLARKAVCKAGPSGAMSELLLLCSMAVDMNAEKG